MKLRGRDKPKQFQTMFRVVFTFVCLLGTSDGASKTFWLRQDPIMFLEFVRIGHTPCVRAYGHPKMDFILRFSPNQTDSPPELVGRCGRDDDEGANYQQSFTCAPRSEKCGSCDESQPFETYDINNRISISETDKLTRALSNTLSFHYKRRTKIRSIA
ncbi:hypothetical protein EVAR_34366_1 [Eumeta japonica]|uniref:Uncharacterized protein n=1 Tax=Eumeta variegata TaxID=151549 RepID=A0A4C1YSK3_EUMVA|nr:hypothetical protein EVAR_34366_1 [Eumeta japonica]